MGNAQFPFKELTIKLIQGNPINLIRSRRRFNKIKTQNWAEIFSSVNQSTLKSR